MLIGQIEDLYYVTTEAGQHLGEDAFERYEELYGSWTAGSTSGDRPSNSLHRGRGRLKHRLTKHGATKHRLTCPWRPLLAWGAVQSLSAVVVGA